MYILPKDSTYEVHERIIAWSEKRSSVFASVVALFARRKRAVNRMVDAVGDKADRAVGKAEMHATGM